MHPHLPPSYAPYTSSGQHLPLPVPATPISQLWFPPVQQVQQEPCEAPAVSADLNILQLPANQPVLARPLNLPQLPLLTSPIPATPATFGPSPQKPLGGNDSDYQSIRTGTAVDQSASAVVPGRKIKVSASREMDEDGENDDSVEVVASSNREVITIDDSDEDSVEILPRTLRKPRCKVQTDIHLGGSCDTCD